MWDSEVLKTLIRLDSRIAIRTLALEKMYKLQLGCKVK